MRHKLHTRVLCIPEGIIPTASISDTHEEKLRGRGELDGISAVVAIERPAELEQVARKADHWESPDVLEFL